MAGNQPVVFGSHVEKPGRVNTGLVFFVFFCFFIGFFKFLSLLF